VTAEGGFEPGELVVPGVPAVPEDSAEPPGKPGKYG
jgi:hypothetical protein